MKRRSLILAALISALALGFAAHQAAADGATASSDVRIPIENYTFKTPKLTIAPGTAVVWQNKDDDPHTVTADDGSFDSKGLGQGDTFRHVFAKPGTFPYHCSAHPYMKGVVIVEEHKS